MADAILDKINQIEHRLSVIEDRLTLKSAADPEVKAGISQAAIDAWADEEAAEQKWQEQKRDNQNNPSESSSGHWLGMIAVICFVLAGGFIIRLSIESGWLTPIRQVGLSSLLGGVLIGAGLRLVPFHKSYASYLPAAGVIILFLTIFAATRYYEILTPGVALPLTGGTAATSIWLYTRIRHDIYPLTASVGLYLSPFIIGVGTESEFSLQYILIGSMGFGIISAFVRSRLLTLVSSYLAIITTSYIGVNLHKDELVATMLGLHFLIFVGSTYLYSRQNKTPLNEGEALFFLPVLFAFYSMEYYFIARLEPLIAPWISLGFSGLLLLIYMVARKRIATGAGSLGLIVSFITLTCFHSVYLQLIPGDIRPWLLVMILLLGAYTPEWLTKQIEGQTRSQSFLIFIPVIAVLVVMAIEYISIILHLIKKDDFSWIMVALASLTSVWLLVVNRREDLEKSETANTVLLAAAHILAITSFYRLTSDIGSLAVSVSWLIYAVAVMLWASVRRDAFMAKSALLVLVIAAGKALLYDASNAPTTVRILCLLVTGAVLYGCGFLMQKISLWKIKKEA